MFIKKDLRKIPTILADASQGQQEIYNHKNDTDKSSLSRSSSNAAKPNSAWDVKFFCQNLSNALPLCQLKSLAVPL
jgi:hypothetical protein